MSLECLHVFTFLVAQRAVVRVPLISCGFVVSSDLLLLV